MVGIVQADAEKLADPGHRLGQAHALFDQRQAVDVGGPHGGQVRQHRTVNVFHYARQVADLAVLVQEAGLFLTLGAITQQLHCSCFPWVE